MPLATLARSPSAPGTCAMARTQTSTASPAMPGSTVLLVIEVSDDWYKQGQISDTDHLDLPNFRF